MRYIHVDVFSRQPYRGNGLAVFPEADGLSGAQMLAITREMRQFESIFLLAGADAGDPAAQIFTEDEELDFAGHPVLGAAAVLHHQGEAGETALLDLRMLLWCQGGLRHSLVHPS